MTLLSFKELIGGAGKIVVSCLSIIGGVEVFKWFSQKPNSNTKTKRKVVNRVQSASAEEPKGSFSSSTSANNQLSAFYLNNIQSLFNRCNIDTSEAGAFQKLLSQIERISFNDTLKEVLDSSRTPVLLHECLSSLKAQEYTIECNTCNSGPSVDSSFIDDMLNKRISDNLSSRTLSEKVEFLINHSLIKGFDSFINLFGEHIKEFKYYYELGAEDKYVPLYNSIIEGIRTSYNLTFST